MVSFTSYADHGTERVRAAAEGVAAGPSEEDPNLLGALLALGEVDEERHASQAPFTARRLSPPVNRNQ